jgi:hypothetical protein
VTDAPRLDAVVGAAQEVFHGEWSRDPSLRAGRCSSGLAEVGGHGQRAPALPLDQARDLLDLIDRPCGEDHVRSRGRAA